MDGALEPEPPEPEWAYEESAESLRLTKGGREGRERGTMSVCV